ncbi:hypothetical protein G7046_g7361 [Stylonectria norvegica]|nr:hypothetical protein G7046_g7361 [Stylonectria norvegica]
MFRELASRWLRRGGQIRPRQARYQEQLKASYDGSRNQASKPSMIGRRVAPGPPAEAGAEASKPQASGAVLSVLGFLGDSDTAPDLEPPPYCSPSATHSTAVGDTPPLWSPLTRGTVGRASETKSYRRQRLEGKGLSRADPLGLEE